MFVAGGSSRVGKYQVTSVESGVEGRDGEQKMFGTVTRGDVKLQVESRELRVRGKRCSWIRITS